MAEQAKPESGGAQQEDTKAEGVVESAEEEEADEDEDAEDA